MHHRPGGLRGHIPGRKAGAAGGKHQIASQLIGAAAQLPADGQLIVRHNSRVENPIPGPLQHGPHRRAAGVRPCPGAAPVADGDNCRLIFHSGTSLLIWFDFIPRTFIRQGQKNPPDAKVIHAQGQHQ